MHINDLRAAVAETAYSLDLGPSFPIEAFIEQMAIELGCPLRVCAFCDREFQVGPGTGRRRDAKFCCPAHQQTSKSLRRSRRQSPGAVGTRRTTA